ncbi:helix-hairpin-helix domain-containing protein [Actinomadura chokoriensis]|uniref:Helix-hairpin-helix domain-containing protein n=1 Tax=Actinomadura chokoriensis TaxID=454156 RepID=A0ABV4R4D9_9ACTN
MRPDAQDRLTALIGRVRPPAPPPDAPPSARLRATFRATPERSHVRTLVLIGVVAALVAAGYLWLARPRPQASAAPMAGATLAGPRPAVSARPAAAPSVVVHVLGKVRRPGVVTLPSGSRVAEAIKAAGGVRPGARTGTLNLARELVDGEQIPVGVPRPAQPPGVGASAGTSGPGASGPGTSGASGAPLDLNAATPDQLDDLPGVGPVLAQRIAAYRAQHGGFRSVEQLQEVSGIGARRFEDLKPMVRV